MQRADNFLEECVCVCDCVCVCAFVCVCVSNFVLSRIFKTQFLSQLFL